jgi:6-phosphofructokinase 1
MNGNILIGQSGGPTSVINASLCGIIEESLRIQPSRGIYGMKHSLEGLLAGHIIDLGLQDPIVVKQLRSTPSSALGSGRYKLRKKDMPAVLERLRQLEIESLFLIGGNDTMGTLLEIQEYCRNHNYPIQCVGVPKTVDNDLPGTDCTPGYGSAARYTALSVQQVGRLVKDFKPACRFSIFQTIGRDTGWLAASSVLAKTGEDDAPHLILLPERPITVSSLIDKTLRYINRFGWCFIVCGEGICFENGEPVSASKVEDRFGNIEYGATGGVSAAITIHRILSEATGLPGEFQVPESLPMCAIDRVSELDRDMAYQCGVKALDLARQGKSGVMTAIKRLDARPFRYSMEAVPLEGVALKTRYMDDHYISENGAFVTDAFIDYVRPLAGELEPYAALAHIPVGERQVS